ncbi:MAG: His/Gly/Thr/Pro-type tRNA ligase C-terminal domain-containing protein, partial [Polyangiaceae bacterium]
TLVRGLDYYTRTLFELKSSSGDLGAQNTLCGGGRYDNMIKSLGGPDVPAIGFAMGLERILLALGEQAEERADGVFIAPLGAGAIGEALVLGRELRQAGIPTEVDGRGNSMKSMLRRANHLGSRLVLVLGDNEIERGVVQLKDFAASEGSGGKAQSEVPRSDVVAQVSELLKAGAA